jgi:hypothetical protein
MFTFFVARSDGEGRIGNNFPLYRAISICTMVAEHEVCRRFSFAAAEWRYPQKSSPQFFMFY